MPIRPIDLQTMLMQLTQVGREQAAEKEGAALTNAMKGAADQKRLDEAKESVHRSKDPDTGPEPVKDREGGGQKPGPGGKEEAGAKEGRPGDKGKEEIVRDPNLGTRIDLSG